VDDASTYTASANPLLTSKALAGVADRPTRVTVAGTQSATVDGGRAATDVSVTYSVGATTLGQTVTVGAGSASSQPYLLRSPFITVGLSGADGRQVNVNGIAVPGGADKQLAYPGNYVATVAGSELIASSTAAAGYESTSGTVTASIALP